jgi:hypothetical protein
VDPLDLRKQKAAEEMGMKYDDILDLVQIMYKAKKYGYFEKVSDSLDKPLSYAKAFNDNVDASGTVPKIVQKTKGNKTPLAKVETNPIQINKPLLTIP